ncbi:TetR/AcrR family transcriptional regulator [Streptacidiphilus jiangxiensis]|uniref:DNA-binding transcriptional regulator, AcrR family n=1 Tax=Streptacidiphilus jiangxiensis TaxID=235985 RepID=A0A1H7PQN2_STRJI|nr:TetR/AcrR family transcriptional regulator [Streptacidiphilus jiangxiensis]SEL37909.1 DNA-binding transcriptional regulator, AcrR family [Streptacidiphilus jiangxiensis]
MGRTPNPDLRSARSRRAILDAAIELGTRDGYAQVTVEAIAARAGVGKQTIYRWWPRKSAVLLEALSERSGPAAEVPDTGDLTADLSQQLRMVIGLLNGELGVVWRGLLADAQSDASLAQELRDNFFTPRLRRWRDRLEAAVATGELRADVPSATMVELLFGPVYYRYLIGTSALDADDAEALIEQIFNGLRPRV